jgi:glycerol dehydrogenase-like iron-containing ADH family enzyme
MELVVRRSLLRVVSSQDRAYASRGLQDLIHQTRIDRLYVIAIGGGAVLDTVGLAAATHLRCPSRANTDHGVE